METHSASSICCLTILCISTTILEVAHYRMLEVLHVNTYLVLTTGVELQFHKTETVGTLDSLVMSDGILARWKKRMVC